MESTLKQLKQLFPTLRFSPGKQFCWSPESGDVFYNPNAHDTTATWSLLHETGHALLNHKSYEADYELIQLEMAAWNRACQLGETLGVTIDEDHIQDCLDTYRDWIYKRSICPSCSTKCLQQDDFVHYKCFNCHTAWRVSPSRFCRAYRSTKNVRQPAVFNLIRKN